jgi:hypothetical protein
METWSEQPEDRRIWSESGPGAGITIRHVVSDLPPHTDWSLSRNGIVSGSFRSDREGRITFMQSGGISAPATYELRRVPRGSANSR